MRFFTNWKNYLPVVLLLTSFSVQAQDELGILLNSEEAMESYTLFDSFQDVYLIDNCGKVVNVWEGVGPMSHHPKLLPNGNLIFVADRFRVREFDWDGNIVNEAAHDDTNLSIEYEVIVLPNGNYLCVGRRSMSMEDFVNLGYDWGAPNSPNVTDAVVELDRNTGDIVWEWNIRDHVIQERDPDANNYGVVADHPELLDLDAIAEYDWTFHESFMINSMDYNPTLDQIAVSVRKMSEIAIIDHSTTTEEAAGHTGGNSGKGGDILYRWGNPQNYGRGDEDDRQLFFQHNPNWITEGVLAGKMIVYDNGLSRPVVNAYSTVPVLDLPVDENGNYTLPAEESYEPALPTVRFSSVESGTYFYSSYTSGAEVLPNGNIFITEGAVGRLMEINLQGELVWSYRVPYASYIYRTEKYPIDYPAFEGRDLIPDGVHPFSTSTYECMLLTSTDEPTESAQFSANYFPAEAEIRLQNGNGNGMNWAIYNVQGQLLSTGASAFPSAEVSILGWPNGLYVIHLEDELNGATLSKKVVKVN